MILRPTSVFFFNIFCNLQEYVYLHMHKHILQLYKYANSNFLFRVEWSNTNRFRSKSKWVSSEYKSGYDQTSCLARFITKWYKWTELSRILLFSREILFLTVTFFFNSNFMSLWKELCLCSISSREIVLLYTGGGLYHINYTAYSGPSSFKQYRFSDCFGIIFPVYFKYLTRSVRENAVWIYC